MARYQSTSRSLTASVLILTLPHLITALPTPTSLPSTSASSTSEPTSSATSSAAPQKGPSMLATISYFGIAVCGSIVVVLLFTAWISYRRKRRPSPPPVSQVRKDFFEYIQPGENQNQEIGPIVMAQTSPGLPVSPYPGATQNMFPLESSPKKPEGKLKFKPSPRYSTDNEEPPPTSSSNKPMLKLNVTGNQGRGNTNRKSFVPDYFLPKRLRRETFVPHPLTAPTKPKTALTHGHVQLPPMPQFGIGAKIAYQPSNSPVTPINDSPIDGRERASRRISKVRGNRRSDAAHPRVRKSRGHSIVSPRHHAHDGHGHGPRQSRVSRRIRPISSTTIASSIVSDDEFDRFTYDDSYDDDVDGDDDDYYYEDDGDDGYSYDDGESQVYHQQQYEHHHTHQQLNKHNTHSREALNSIYDQPVLPLSPLRRDDRRPTTANTTSSKRSVAVSPGFGIHAVQIPPHSPRERDTTNTTNFSRGYTHSSSGRSPTSTTSKTSRTTTTAATTKSHIGGSSLRHVYNETDATPPTPPPVPPKDWEVVPVQIGGFPTFVATIKPSSRAGLPMNPRPEQREQQGHRDLQHNDRARYGRI
ncbi:hypothetical protein Dda_6214 [Drechslerella dactyloides]|uniref:Uncharacterized protein n=1 Tax=Drechslerella dactyloides TaxID=74499 RepID=A0AAD6NIA4_DREDA|nr:hypothetical protein Dda_6214 [Drechslerella dactyloides]